MSDRSTGRITQHGFRDEVQKLMAVPQDHILAVPRDNWRKLASELEEDDGRLCKELARELQISDTDLRKCQVSVRFRKRKYLPPYVCVCVCVCVCVISLCCHHIRRSSS